MWLALAPGALAAGLDDPDGDGIPTEDEAPDRDTDGDGAPDWQDPDDDEDGVPTADEDFDGDGDPKNDGAEDGVPDYLDRWVPTDTDRDGHQAEAWGGDDCDDTDPATHPGEFDQLYDGVDRDCDGWSDYDGDRDGYDNWFEAGGDDCDDADPEVNPAADEEPSLGDADCDGWSDTENPLVANGGCDCDQPGAPVGAAPLALLLLLRRRAR